MQVVGPTDASAMVSRNLASVHDDRQEAGLDPVMIHQTLKISWEIFDPSPLQDLTFCDRKANLAPSPSHNPTAKKPPGAAQKTAIRRIAFRE